MSDNRTTAAPAVGGALSLSPVLVFAILYLAVSVAAGDFYAMPLPVAFGIASAWAMATMRGHTLAERVETFSRGAAQPGILYMIWIYLLAGGFASLARSCGAIDATVALALHYLPSSMILPGLFAAACFISMSVGSSVGTVVALTPLGVSIARGAGADIPLYVGAILGGAFFGDNLSFISDTTIAATRSLGVEMKAKFRANLRIVLPAALVALGIYVALGSESPEVTKELTGNFWLVIPYLTVIALAVAGVNVVVVLGCGITSAYLIGLVFGMAPLDGVGALGNGMASMGELSIITLLAAGMLGIIKETGGIDWMLRSMTAHISSVRGARFVIATLVATVNFCTANNTVAIITVGTLSRDIARRYGLPPARVASVLDTCSCIVQSLIPYGAQTLLATSLAGISAVAPWPYLYYPFALTLSVTLFMLLARGKPVER